MYTFKYRYISISKLTNHHLHTGRRGQQSEQKSNQNESTYSCILWINCGATPTNLITIPFRFKILKIESAYYISVVEFHSGGPNMHFRFNIIEREIGFFFSRSSNVLPHISIWS